MAQNDVIKALCQQIERRYGAGKDAALVARVSPGVWSQYCSDAPQNADITIPFGRLLMVANTAEKLLFAQLLLDSDPGDEPTGDLLTEAQEATEAAADLQHDVREFRRAGPLTPARKAAIRSKAAALLKEGADVIVRLDRAG